tara:strand:- start:153 stop:464 length:312 start_codon:yes stop_codon:yes gene_type:complete
VKRPYLLAVLLVFITGCKYESKYESKYEADKACLKWADEGLKFQFKLPWGEKWDGYSRRCILESDTNQILGFEIKDYWKLNSKVWSSEEVNEFEEKVMKHFKY